MREYAPVSPVVRPPRRAILVTVGVVILLVILATLSMWRAVHDPRRDYFILLAGGLLAAFAILAGVAWWQRQTARHALRQLLAERRQRDTTERLALMMQLANDAILLADGQLRIVEANTCASDVYDYTTDELRRLTIPDLRAPQAQTGTTERFAATPVGGGARFESWHRRKDGAAFPVEVSLRKVDIGGRPHVLAIIRDITERQRLRDALEREHAQFRLVFEYAPVGLSLGVGDQQTVLVNAEHARLTGVPVAESGVPGVFERASHPDDYARQMAAAQPYIRGEADHFTVEKRYLHPDGSVQWAELTSRARINPATGIKHSLTTLTDINQRKRHELEIERLNRFYRIISQVNQALVRAKDSGGMLDEVCRVLVEVGSFRLAWVGALNAASGIIEPVAVAGDTTGYVTQTTVNADPAQPAGQGPSGLAVREGRTYVCNDFFADPATTPWREAALRAGFRASIALPLACEGRPFGMLAAYAEEAQTFGAPEVALLEEAASDISFALTAFAREKSRLAAEAERLVSEQRFRELFELVADPLIVYDLMTGRILQANPAAAQVYGRSVTELLTLRTDELSDEPEATIILRRSLERQRGKQINFVPLRWHRRADGSRFPVEISQRVYLRDGQWLMISVIRDVTEHQAVQERLRSFNRELEQQVGQRTMELSVRNQVYESLRQANPDMVLHLRRDGTVRHRQPAKGDTPLAQPVCNDPAAGAGSPTAILQAAALAAGRQALAEHATTVGECELTVAGARLFVELRAAPAGADEFVVFLRDITRRKLYETNLAALLEREREASEMKTRFIAVTSHEFRTPMAVALASADLLTQHSARLPPSKQQELLARIGSSLGRMNEMLDDLLLLNRVDAGRLQPQTAPADLPRLLADIVEETRLADRDAHRFVVQTDGVSAPFVTDTGLLRHILSNLLGNAVRYSPADTTITVTLASDPAGLTLAVADQGIGIPERDRPRLFQPFERGSNVGQIKGTGLGLNIVKRLTELLDGTVIVEPVVPAGTRFVLRLPVHPPTAPTP